MEVLRAKIDGWVTSFRYPIFVTGVQPSLPVPPLSTVYGLLSAARGQPVTPADVSVGYLFFSSGKAVDLETIYELSSTPLRAKSNVVKRHLLFRPELYLYISDLSFDAALRKPAYPLLLGRSGDLVVVSELKRVTLERPEDTVRVGHTLLPFPTPGVAGPIQALPTHFTDTVPRKAVGTRPFVLVDRFYKIRGDDFWLDPEHDWGVFLHARG